MAYAAVINLTAKVNVSHEAHSSRFCDKLVLRPALGLPRQIQRAVEKCQSEEVEMFCPTQTL